MKTIVNASSSLTKEDLYKPGFLLEDSYGNVLMCTGKVIKDAFEAVCLYSKDEEDTGRLFDYSTDLTRYRVFTGSLTISN